MDLDAILAELGRIRERLEDAVDGAEYAALVDQRSELRRAAREATPPTREALEIELERLVAAWDRLQRRRIDVVKQAGDLAAGNFGFTSDAMAINREIDEASGRTDLEQRIQELRRHLASLEE